MPRGCRPALRNCAVRIANWTPVETIRACNTMDDPYDLALSMFALAIAAVMLVAGELYLVTRPDPQTVTPPPPVLTSSIK